MTWDPEIPFCIASLSW